VRIIGADIGASAVILSGVRIGRGASARDAQSLGQAPVKIVRDRVVATGGAGFIGSALVERLVAEGKRVPVGSHLAAKRATCVANIAGASPAELPVSP
jgi:hypothetical protein